MPLHAVWARRLLAGLGAAAAVAAWGQAPAGTEQRVPTVERPWRVVLVRGWDAMFASNVVREQAMRAALFADSPRRIEVHAEEVDPMRFPAVNSLQSVELMHRKYETAAVDLVIASGIDALDYVVRHRSQIWPDAAIMFYGVPDGFLEGRTLPHRTTGHTISLDVAGTLELALALVPKARKAYIVAGIAPFDRMFLGFAQRVARRFAGRLEIHEIAGLDRGETVERLQKLERDTIVLYLTTVQEGDGRYAGPMADIIPLISTRSAAPVFVAVQTIFGRGPVGGSGGRFADHGRESGQLARRILEGTDPDTVPVMPAPGPSCEVDWIALQRWKLPTGRIPPHCALVNQPVPIWKAYFWPLVGMAAIILLQAGLISAFLIQRSMRRRAESQLQARAGELAQVSRMAMMGELTAGIAHEINQPIGAILSNSEAAQLMLQQGTLDRDKLREILEDIRDQDLRAGDVIQGLRNLMTRREWKPIHLDLNAQVADALKHVTGQAGGRRVRVASIYGSDVPNVRGDSLQLQQVIINLVNNAVDAVVELPESRRVVTVETRAEAGGAEIVVSDQGPGIDPSHQGEVFQSRFTTKPNGMGFGLSIVRAIAEMHGGRVSHEPVEPQGARFRVWLPATQS